MSRIIKFPKSLYFKRGIKSSSFRNAYSIIEKPGFVDCAEAVPVSLETPSYAKTGIVTPSFELLKPKSKHEIPKIRKACEAARKVLWAVTSKVKPGVTTEKIDYLVHWLSYKFEAYPSPLNYRGFPKSVCTSVNNVACHGIPDDRPLEDGDIISIDVSCYRDGYHGDTCNTILVGDVDQEGRRLVEVAKKCLDSAIEICGPGVKFNKIGKTISSFLKGTGYSVCDVFCGHGIGKEFHTEPQIIHCANNYPGKMWPGMTFTIEPVICEGSPHVEILDDGWTAVTVDKKKVLVKPGLSIHDTIELTSSTVVVISNLSRHVNYYNLGQNIMRHTEDSEAAQFEHTILVTDYGFEVLTIDKEWNEDIDDLLRFDLPCYMFDDPPEGEEDLNREY